MQAKTLADAVSIQNDTDYGLTAGIHSLNLTEIKTWTNSVEAGNLYVNRGITGAIVERQPFGGLKRSSVGFSLKAGGANYIFQFGKFVDSDSKFAGINQYQVFKAQPMISKYLKSVELLVETNRDYLKLELAAASDQHWLHERACIIGARCRP
jgi:RHH-type proline utilization regulon transcriptional repressor/proline dehydrogenase/delta 1-pyrroline-5-carboxylate dehydrogenase